jgi:hypothetical protein
MLLGGESEGNLGKDQACRAARADRFTSQDPGLDTHLFASYCGYADLTATARSLLRVRVCRKATDCVT